MKKDDQFLHDFRKDPPSEAVNALWHKLSTQKKRQVSSNVGFYPRLVLGSLALLLVLALWIPPVRAFAQEAFQLFALAAQDTFSINFNFEDPVNPDVEFADTNPPNVNVDVFVTELGEPSIGNTNFVFDSLVEAHAEFDRAIYAPVNLPEGYELQWAVARMNSPLWTLVYSNDEGQQLIFHQQRMIETQPVPQFDIFVLSEGAGNGRYQTNLQIDIAFGEIGPGTSVHPIQIGGISGEHVYGSWEIDPVVLNDRTVSANTEISVSPAWQADAPGQMLRWQVANTFFELIVTDAAITRADLVSTAESIE